MIKPWRDAFRRNPEQAIADLMSGRAGLGSGLRLDVPELLYQVFPDRPERADERAHLDHALLNWLRGMRQDYAAQVKRLDFAVYAKRLCDALIALQLLDLPSAREQIRDELDAWLRWLRPLRLAPERDPALECWRLLTRGQPDGRHTAAWLHLAADPRPEYLTVALSGLQRLPNDGDARANQVLMVHALLRHAIEACRTAHEARAFFNRQFAALRGLHGPFPGAPQHWREVLAEALDGFSGNARERKPRELVQLVQANEAAGFPRRRRHRAYSAVPDERQRELEREVRGTKRQGDDLARRLFTHSEQNYHYAESTGDSYPFVRELSSVGSRLLRRHRLGEDVIGRFELMIERALTWAPMDPYVWSLWTDWFRYQGRSDAQEWTLREATRLFPDNATLRVELARLLILRRGKAGLDEAERYLYEAADRDATDEHARVELARLLIFRRGKAGWDEAERHLREAADRDPNRAPSRVELARLLILRHGKAGWDEAERRLREAADRNPTHEHSRVELARLLIRRGEDHWGEAERRLREVTRRDPDSVPTNMVMAGLLLRRHRVEEAKQLFAKVIKRERANRAAQDALDRLEAGIALHPDETDLADDWHTGESIPSTASGDDGHADAQPAAGTTLDPDETDLADDWHTEKPIPSTASAKDGHANAQPASPSASQEPASPVPHFPLPMPTAALSPQRASAWARRTEVLNEITRRGRLGAEFSYARAAKARGEIVQTSLIEQEAAKGDNLAGFYSQWLEPERTASPPPHAWAWNASRLWQQAAPSDEWARLEERFAEAEPQTAFLRLLDALDHSGDWRSMADRWRARYGDKDDATARPVLGFIEKDLERLGAVNRDARSEIALAVLASSAEAPPVFVG